MKQQSKGSGDSFQSAIDDAIGKAIAAARASGKRTDSMIRWKLLDVTGQEGGIAQLHITEVTIEYES